MLPALAEYTLSACVQEVKVDIYRRIQSEQAGLTEDDFDELLHDTKHEELDDNITKMYKDEVDKLLCEYGIAEAFDLYASECGWDAKSPPNTKMVLYTVVSDRLNDLITYADYKEWCEEDEEDQSN